MRVHVFGNSPSPAIATLGLRKVALKAESKYGSHITQFVGKDFYVDDGLISCATSDEAIKVMKDTIISLRKRRSTPRRLFNKSGPVSRTLFSDIP
jgi:hypothetical protein